MHLSRHTYKRGQFKGDAPADSSRRAKSHFRVVKGNGGQMIVRMHNADLITAYEDGRIVLNTRGWSTSPTTRRCMNESLRGFFGMGYIYSVRKWGHSQTGIKMNGKTYHYYDGIEFGADGTLLSVAKVFTAKRTDREETAEFRADIKESGFVDVFPVLYQAAEVPKQGWLPVSTHKIMTEDHNTSYWPDLVSLSKYPTYASRSRNTPTHPDHKHALRALIASVTKNMTKFVETDVTVL
jgi:hypothetical protein